MNVEFVFIICKLQNENMCDSRHIWPAPVVICQLLSSIIMSKLKLIFGLCVCVCVDTFVECGRETEKKILGMRLLFSQTAQAYCLAYFCQFVYQ